MSVSIHHLAPHPIGSVQLITGPTATDVASHALVVWRNGRVVMGTVREEVRYDDIVEPAGYQLYASPEDLIKWCEATIQMMRERLAEWGGVTR